MKRNLTISIGLIVLLSAAAFGQLRIVPMKYSKVNLVSGKNSAVVDLENDLTKGTLAGNPPHIYRVLFTAKKAGFLYLVANVRSSSPISDPMGPCGGDAPQSILWIKADATLKTREMNSEIYESCSYNFYDSKLRVTKTGFTAHYGGRELKTMKYDNREPEKGLVVTSMLEPPDKKE